MELQPVGFGIEENRATAYTGNLNVGTISHSPVGAHPDPNYVDPIPTVDELEDLAAHKLSGYEDYICWGEVEKTPGQCEWLEPEVAEKIQAWMDAGGKTIFFGNTSPKFIDGTSALKFQKPYRPEMLEEDPTLMFLKDDLPDFLDMKADGLWVTVYRDGKWLLYNNTDRAIEYDLAEGKMAKGVLEAHTILELQ